jgi:AraC-like DNA-binding protein
MTLNFFTILTLFSVFLTSILSLFFFVTRKGPGAENKILGTLLVIFNLQIFYSFATSIYTYQYFLEWHKTIFLLRQTSLLIGPLFYLYVNSFLKRKEILHTRSLFHFLPFIAVVIILLILFRQPGRFIIWLSVLDLYDTLFILGSNLVYIILCFLGMRSMKISLRGLFKRIEIASHNTWLQILLLGFIVIWIMNLNSFAIYMIAKKPVWCAYTASIYALSAFLFVNAIMFLLLVNPDAYYIITKYRNNKIKEEDKEDLIQRLNSVMESGKSFLNPEISLESLASEVPVAPRILSQLINETYHKNFKGYILEFRIKESMKILEDPNQRDLTILEILYRVGFNSKSAFNHQFKLYTRLTPLEYRSKFTGG